MLDAAISTYKPWMYHFTNLILHILTSISFYFLLKHLSFRNITAFFTALLFSIHPLFTAAVSWIPARGDLMIGLFGIWSMISFGKHIREKKLKYFIINIIFFALGIFSKETSLFFPFILLFYYFFILKNNHIETDLKDNSTGGKTLLSIIKTILDKKLIPYYTAWIIVTITYLYFKFIVSLGIPPNNLFGFKVFIYNLQTIPIIIGKLFIPLKLSPLPIYDINSTAIGIIFLFLTAYITSKYLPFRATLQPEMQEMEKEKRIPIMGAVWFFLFAIPPMFYRVRISEYFFTYLEHRFYLPLIGLFILFAYYIDNNLYKLKTPYLKPVIIAVFLIYITISYTYCEDYKNSYNFFTSAINANPENVAGYYDRGYMFIDEHRYKEAINDFNQAVLILHKPDCYFGKAFAEKLSGDYADAEKDYTMVISLDTSVIALSAYINRSFIREHYKNYEGALQDLQNATKIDPDNKMVYFNAGNICMTLKNYQYAINNFSIALDLQPNFPDALNNRIIARYNIKDYTGIIEDCNKLVQFNYDLENTYNNMGIAYLNLSKYDEAIDCFNKSININKNFANAYYNRGLAEQKKNNLNDARKDWQEALRLGCLDAKKMLK
jgi:tetratricopeptide (TPR) repeat protein